ncbi:hypothetical protein C5167_027346, partial [Papaver somniferum]
MDVSSSGIMGFQPIMEELVFRFDCSGNDRNAASNPSISFTDPKVRDTPLLMVHGVQPTHIPTFDCADGQQIISVELPTGTSLYGTGEVSGQLEQTGKKVITWNTDAWGYDSGTTSLYQSHPWVLAVLPNGEAFGVLADTTQRCEIDLREESTIKIKALSPYPVITFGPFASPTAVLQTLSRAIGTVFMPPKWSLGYHQCRFSYESDARVLEVARTFREKGIPCDVIWMDIDYMDGFRCFTFDKKRFSQPKTLVNELHRDGFKAIWMLDPGIKREEGYFVYDSGSEKDVWVQKADGQPFVGDVWPGPCVFPDYTQEKTRSWWANLVKDFVANGVDGIWNDMNEPAVFKTVTKTMPETNIHRGDAEVGGHQNHSHYHNVYGTLMARSTFEGMKLANEKKRPFVLTRADGGFTLMLLIIFLLGSDALPHVLPTGIWLSFDFDDSHPDLPTLYLQGGSIIPVGLPVQHVDEANATDDLSLIVALDQHGKAEGVLYEDEGDGYEFSEGGYLLTYYAAELQSSVVTVKVSKTEGSWNRPKRRLHVDAWGIDGQVLQIKMPSDVEISKLISTSQEQYKNRIECAEQIPDAEEVSEGTGVELSKTPVELKSDDWALKILPWIGGRMISMQHLPSGTQWLHNMVEEVDGYEEYSGVEYRSAGCSEKYTVIERAVGLAGEEEESLSLEGDIGGGLVLERQISIPKTDPKVIQIDSGIIARNIGAGSGGFSRVVCLRVHPVFTLLHPTEVFVSFVSINGSKHELWPGDDEQFFEGDLRPNDTFLLFEFCAPFQIMNLRYDVVLNFLSGEWILFDKHLGTGLVNRFNLDEVAKCMVHWGTGTVNLELWSEERPVSKESPLKISHQY